MIIKEYNAKELISEKKLVEEMYSIITSNMKNLYSDFVVKKEDYNLWFENCIKSGKQKTLIALDNGSVCGYLQYNKDIDHYFWCEMQIKKENQGDSYTFFNIIKNFIDNNCISKTTLIKGKINPKNEKSINVFTHLGFTNILKTEYHLMGDKLLEWYNNKTH